MGLVVSLCNPPPTSCREKALKVTSGYDIKTLHLKPSPESTCFFTAFTLSLKVQHVHQFYCKRHMWRRSFIGPGDMEDETKSPKGLKSSICVGSGHFSSVNTDPMLFPEYAGKCVCTTSLCWRQPRLLPASIQQYFYWHQKCSSPHHPSQQW